MPLKKMTEVTQICWLVLIAFLGVPQQGESKNTKWFGFFFKGVHPGSSHKKKPLVNRGFWRFITRGV
jgi:hypothetical protein